MNLQYKELTDRAFYYHSHNEFSKAEEIYKQLLIVNPDDANVLNLYGMLCLVLRKPDEAISFLSKAFLLQKCSYIASNLAKAYYMNNEPEKSVKMYNQALTFEQNDDIYYSLALAYKKIGNYDKLIESYKKAIELNPQNYNANYNLSLAYNDAKDTENAIFYAKKCLEIKKEDDVYALLSGYYEEINDINSAVYALKNAILLNGREYLYFYNLGVLYSKIGKIKEAELAYLKSIELNDSFIGSYVNIASLYKDKNNEKALEYLYKANEIDSNDEKTLLSLAQTFKDLYKHEESIKILNKILTVNINSHEAYSLLGMNYMDKGNYAQALEYYEKALNLDSSNLNYLHGKAVALKYLGNIEQAKEILQYIVEKDKSAIQSATTLGMMYLTEKDFINGMKLYTMRSKESKFNEVFKEKIWSYPEKFDNKDILIYSDCGFGDTIMFSRFLRDSSQRAKTLTLQTDKSLISLLKNSFKNINIIPKGTKPNYYDTVISIMDLQYALGIDFSKVSSKPYLVADENKINMMSQLEIINGKKNRVGLLWQGNRRIFKNRSVDFKYIEKLLKIDGISFYSFQMDNETYSNENLYSLKEYIQDYSDTAALLKNMDLLITIDSSMVHIAGALGIKTYLMLPYTSEWRWFNDTENSLWYESVKIFKQKENCTWDSVIEEITKELYKLC